jgi:hypothetical protein
MSGPLPKHTVQVTRNPLSLRVSAGCLQRGRASKGRAIMIRPFISAGCISLCWLAAEGKRQAPDRRAAVKPAPRIRESFFDSRQQWG